MEISIKVTLISPKIILVRYFIIGLVKKKVIEALKNNTFNFHKSAGVETGIWLSIKESLAIEYSKIANGNDNGVI
jgi:hypothetical protein